MSTLEASSCSNLTEGTILIGEVPSPRALQPAAVDSPRPPRTDEAKATEVRLRAVDAIALCMASGCVGG